MSPARRSPIGTSYHSRDLAPASANGHRETSAEMAGPVVDAELVPERVDQIIRHEAAADRKQAESETHRWEAARLISEELAAGKSQVKLADEISKSETHVRYMKKAWAIGGGEPRFTFNEAYQLAKEPEAPAVPPADSSDPAGTLLSGYARTADGKIVPPAGNRPSPGKGKKPKKPRTHVFEIKTPLVNPRVTCVLCGAVWDHGCELPAQPED